ncbi:unnamed protein product [Penicillium glandicola]
MRNFIALAAFAAGANALVGRTDSCCFHLTSSGGASGELGQLSDGQNRIGDNTLQPAQYCIDSNGAITDSKGRGCILTPPTTQLQCDEGAIATPGFSINSKGQLKYNNSPEFVACATGQNGGLNVYTTPNKDDVTGCVNVQLSADTCSNSGTGAGNGASSSAGAPHVSSAQPAPVPQSTAPAAGPGPLPTPGPGAVAGGHPGSSAAASAPAPSAAAPGGGAGGGTGGGTPAVPSGSPLAGSTQTVLTTVTITDCSHCTACGVPSAPAAAGGGQASVPGAQPSAPAAGAGAGAGGAASAPGAVGGGQASVPGAQPSAPGAVASGAGGAGPQPSATVSAPSGGAGIKPSVTQAAPAGGGGGGTQPGATASAPAPAGGGTSQPGVSTSVPAPAGGGDSKPAFPTSAPAATGSPQPSRSPSIPATSGGSPHPTGSASASVPAGSASSTHSATGTTGACATTLQSGAYETPHLIVQVDSSSPDTAPGNSLNGTVTSTISSVFNFDIPSSDSGKTCSLVFLFPKLEDLETSSYSFSGDGSIDFAKLSSTVDSSTTSNTIPSVSQDFGTITVSPGNSYLVSTFSCPAGEAVSYEMKNAGSTDLNFFEDWNPSPLGLYITTC